SDDRDGLIPRVDGLNFPDDRVLPGQARRLPDWNEPLGHLLRGGPRRHERTHPDHSDEKRPDVHTPALASSIRRGRLSPPFARGWPPRVLAAEEYTPGGLFGLPSGFLQ